MKKFIDIVLHPASGIALIVLSGLFAYSNTFNLPFIFDDDYFIVLNPAVKSLDNFHSLIFTKTFTIYEEFATRTLTFLTFALNYKAGGLNPAGFHALNLIIHILNSIVLYLLLTTIFETNFLKKANIEKNSVRYIAFFSSLLFVVHPVQTEAVSYISQRFTSLAALFYLLTFYLYLKFRLATSTLKRLVYYVMSFLSAVCAVKSKEIALTMPITIGLFEFMFLDGKVKKRIGYLIPISLTILIIPLILYMNSNSGDFLHTISRITRTPNDIPRADYLFTEIRAMVTYIRLLFLPIGLHIDYDYPYSWSFFEGRVFFSFIFICLMFYMGMRFLRLSKVKSPLYGLVSFGIFWFFITNSVESSFIPAVDVIFEHRLYLPSAFVFASFVTGVLLIPRNAEVERNRIATIFFIFIASLFAVLTFNQNKVWSSPVSLWENSVRNSPNKYGNHNYLGAAYKNAGLMDEAIREFKTALDINPKQANAYLNIGEILELKGMVDNAIDYYQTAIENDPDFYRSYVYVGKAYMKKGMNNKAIEYFNLSVMLNPGFPEPHLMLGNAYMSENMVEDAISSFVRATEADPFFVDAHIALGIANAKKGAFWEAQKEFETALSLDPKNLEVLSYLNNLKDFLRQGN